MASFKRSESAASSGNLDEHKSAFGSGIANPPLLLSNRDTCLAAAETPDPGYTPLSPAHK